uniref:Uncharacterized protein n=1 Tax=Utricularia reniformis TaxID=192314 RepID=A0A1Y0AZD8_9LAMI|nr:hypothetical protein AEK19_MT0270 [Utricularia reniformis]ART30546.1 hypothetical protein AEK19_MT0270 [Utricularia reniformis]
MKRLKGEIVSFAHRAEGQCNSASTWHSSFFFC